MLVITCPITFVPSYATDAVFQGEDPVAKSDIEVTTNEVGSPDKPVKLIDEEALDGVVVAVPT